MLKIITEEFTWMFGHKSLIKMIYNYNIDNSFRVQCKIQRIIKMRNRIIKSIALNRLEKRYTIKIGYNAKIGEHLYVHHYQGTIIGDKSKIGDNCEIFQQVTIGNKNNKYPTIGDNVIMFPGCKIIGDIKIGNNAIICPNSVVVKDVPENAVVSGIPARVIKWRQ